MHNREMKQAEREAALEQHRTFMEEVRDRIEQARELARAAVERVREMLRELPEQVREAVRTVEDLVREHEAQRAVVDEAGHEAGHAVGAQAHGVEQVVVDVVDLEVLERVVKHLHRVVEVEVLEVAHLGGHIVVAALVLGQGLAQGGLALALAVGWRGVEVVHTVLDGIVHLLLHHLLVDDAGATLTLARVRVEGGQAHHAVAQQRHLLARLGIGAVGHFALGGLVAAVVAITRGAAHDGGHSRGRTIPPKNRLLPVCLMPILLQDCCRLIVLP